MGNFFSFDRLDEKSTQRCNIYTNVKRKSTDNSFLGISGFEGIPQNFLINLMSWTILNLFFILLRKKAWNYGRMALMQKEELKWTDMFYGDDESLNSVDVSDSAHNNTEFVTTTVSPDSGNNAVDTLGSPTTLTAPAPKNDNSNGKNNNNSSASVTQIGSDPLVAPDQKDVQVNEIRDSGYFAWIKIVFTLTDEQYLDKCGPDCVYYLSFQRHLVLLSAIITACSMFIILPINMHPTTALMGFARTTIINLSNKPDGTNYISFLWAHVVLSIVFLFISIWIMRRYSKGLQFIAEDSIDVSQTICIIGVNRDNCREDFLRAHLVESYPGAEILEVSFAYNISNLQQLEFKRLSASSAKLYFQELFLTEKAKQGEGYNKRPKIRPYVCGVMGCWFKSKYCYKCQCKETDAIDFYANQEQEFTENVDKERQKALTTPLGIAFVTFGSIETAERIVEDYACSARLLLHTPESKYTKDLNSNHWIVKFAPVPEDIYWENLTLDFKMWYMKFFGINILLTIMVIIFSTPVYAFTLLAGPNTTDYHQKDKDQSFIASAIIDTLPTGVVWVLGVILISLVYQSDALIGFWTKTAGNLSEMLKIFFFLTFMVIVLPAIGVTSISYFWSDKNARLSWSCIFYEGNGALFVNYICTSSLTGTAAELMRLPELFLYAVKLWFARSVAEVGAIRKSVLWDFQIGSNYAWIMLHFALFTCFSVIYPLVTPFGLLYLILKHLVDRYNIYFAYAPCKVEKEVHATAVNFVIMSMFMLQINLLAYVHFHIGKPNESKTSNPQLRVLQVFSLLGFSVTAALFLGQVCFNVCADFSPIHHFKNMITDQDEVLEVASATQPLLMAKGASSDKRSAPDRNELIPLRSAFSPAISTMQVGIGGEIRIVPYSAVNSSKGNQITIDGTQNTYSRSERTSLVISSNYTGSGKPYGRYIPPLLRPEFVRLALASQNPPPPPPQSQEQPRKSKQARKSSVVNVDVVSEKKPKKK